MKILEIKILKGPNYWSNYRKKLIVMKVDIGEFEDKPTTQIPGFLKRIKLLLPGMHLHRCSYGIPGGFFKRVEEGTWAGHVIEHIALEIQSLAGMKTGFGRTRSTGEKGVYSVIYSYIDEDAGTDAAKASVEIFLALSNGTSIKSLRKQLLMYIDQLKIPYAKKKPGPSTSSIIKEAERRKIPVSRLNDDSLVQLGYGFKQKRIDATITSKTNYISVDIASDKEQTKNLLKVAAIPVPRGTLISGHEEIEAALDIVSFPLVVKPLNANWGKGVTTNIQNKGDLIRAFTRAKRYSDKIIVEKFIQGKDYRVLIINGKMVVASERIPAHVIGDGKSTIKQLVKTVNSDPWRGEGHENYLTKITLNQDSKELLKKKNYTFSTILPKDEILYLKMTANLSSGGTAVNVTAEVHKQNTFLFERAAAVIGLDICGIDVTAASLAEPITENDGAIIEVNAAPGFRMHLSPSAGARVNVARNVIDMLFPGGDNGRIPIFSITGTNGKTTTTRLIAYILRMTGKVVGYTTTDGIYINNYIIEKGDTSGPVSAEKILSDPMVEIAVLETARGGILRKGLAFDSCDYGIITNITEDHIGLNGINTIEEMARVKSVVANSVNRNGYAILNADDPLVLAIREELNCNVALFGMNGMNNEISIHTVRGGIAVIVEDNFIVIRDGREKTLLLKVQEIPLTFNGKAECMIQNILAATAALYCAGIPVFTIIKGLLTFLPGDANNPGRFNLFRLRNFSIMVDYAHNPAGFESLRNFLQSSDAEIKTGVFEATGDRRDKDIKKLGNIAAEMFDKIVIKEDPDLRGRKAGQGTEILKYGLMERNYDKTLICIEDETEALTRVMNEAQPGELIVFLASDIQKVLHQIKVYAEQEKVLSVERTN